MCNSDNQKYPFLGIGWLSNIDDEHFKLSAMFLELIVLVMLEGMSWILCVLCLGIYFGSAFKQECGEMFKKISLFFLPKVEKDFKKEVVGKIMHDSDAEKFSRNRSCILFDAESVGWINDVLGKLWNGCLQPIVTTDILNDIVEDLADEMEDEEPDKAALLKQITVERMSLGSCPLQISKIESHVNQRDELMLDVTVEYPGNAELVLKWNDPDLYSLRYP